MKVVLALRLPGILLAVLTSTGWVRAHAQWVRYDQHNRGAIVFVHGVTGNGRSTWTSATSGAYWPEMLTHDSTFDGQNIYVYSYESPINDEALTIDQLASNMRTVLVTDGVLREGELTFVSHSMGGIVTRGFILRYRADVASKIRFLYFFATPTDGSEYAKISGLSRNPQFGQILPIKQDGPRFLENQRDDWLAAKFPFPSYCAYEHKLMFGWFTVVGEGSAVLLCGTNRAINEDHITIVKPTNQNSDSYRVLKEAFIETKPLTHPDEGKVADSAHPTPTKPRPHATTTTSTPKEPSLADRTIKLSEELDKFRLRQKVTVPRPTFIEDQKQFQETVVEYHRTFDLKVSKITAELESCSVDVSKIREEVALVDSAPSIAPIDFVGHFLELAANAIPEGQPKCGTGQPTQGFGMQQNGSYEVEMGGGISGWPGGKGMEGRTNAVVTKFGDNSTANMTNFPTSSISVYLRDGLFCVDAKIVYGGPGAPLIDVICNRVNANVPAGWDTNLKENAMEVVNQNQTPVFQLIFVNPRRVQVNGIIPTGPNRYNIYFPGGWSKVTGDPNHPPIEMPLKPLFKYPAWNHRGESAN